MTRLAPIDRTSSTPSVLQTPVTSAPNDRAICTPNVPTPPAAPLIKTLCPGWIRPFRGEPAMRWVLPSRPTAACSNAKASGFVANADCEASA
jgi:hypothetical protein